MLTLEWDLNERYQNPSSQIAQFFAGNQTAVVPKENKAKTYIRITVYCIYGNNDVWICLLSDE